MAKLPKVITSIKDQTKRELIKKLIEDEPEEDQRFIFVIEYQKINETLGFMKFEVFDKEKTVFRIKIQQDITQINPAGPTKKTFLSANSPQNQFNWSSLKVGEKKFVVGLVDLEAKGIFDKIREGIETSMEEGRIPFMS